MKTLTSNIKFQATDKGNIYHTVVTFEYRGRTYEADVQHNLKANAIVVFGMHNPETLTDFKGKSFAEIEKEIIQVYKELVVPTFAQMEQENSNSKEQIKMKKYTKEQLNNMLAEEVRSIAKNEFKLALSSQGKRFTKPQLISKIMGIHMVSDVVEELKAEERKCKLYTGSDIGKQKGRPLPQKYDTLPLDKKHIEGQAQKARTLLKQALNDIELKKAITLTQQAIAFWKAVSKQEKKNMFQKRKIDKEVLLMEVAVKPYLKKVGK